MIPRGPHPTTVVTGRRFEAAAARYLEDRGFTVLARNVRSGRAEVDLVVERDGVVAFVEVKGRVDPDGTFGTPLQAITRRKRREIESVARTWIREHPQAAGYRFDAVSIRTPHRDAPREAWVVEHVEDAWRPGL